MVAFQWRIVWKPMRRSLGFCSLWTKRFLVVMKVFFNLPETYLEIALIISTSQQTLSYFSHRLDKQNPQLFQLKNFCLFCYSLPIEHKEIGNGVAAQAVLKLISKFMNFSPSYAKNVCK